jgi:hypothetical protein
MKITKINKSLARLVLLAPVTTVLAALAFADVITFNDPCTDPAGISYDQIIQCDDSVYSGVNVGSCSCWQIAGLPGVWQCSRSLSCAVGGCGGGCGGCGGCDYYDQ